MTATVRRLPYERRDRYPIMCYPMPWAAPRDYATITQEMSLHGTHSSGRPKAMYMHIPFCEYLCGFCPFVKYAKDSDRIEQYLADLKNELDLYAGSRYFTAASFGSLYLGGGTASILTPRQLADIITYTTRRLRFEEDAEITLECSPITVDPAKFDVARSVGVNRVSFGVQTFDEAIGTAADVAQDGDRSRQVIRWAKAAGIDHVSIDLIYNLPGQSDVQLIADIDTALEEGVRQVTLFPLSVMPHTKLFRDVNERKIAQVGELAHELELCQVATAHLKDRGLRQTSVPDFSAPGVTYRHARIHFSEFEDLLGVGAGAMGTINEYTYVNVGELKRYTELTGQRVPPVNAGQRTPEDERPRATMAMGLRMLSVSAETFRARHGMAPYDAFPELLDNLAGRGLIEHDAAGVRLTALGTLFGYDVAKEFYSDAMRARGQRLAESLARKRDVVHRDIDIDRGEAR